MRAKLSIGLTILLLSSLLVGCGLKTTPTPFSAINIKEKDQTTGAFYEKKVDNFLIILDSSSSMFNSPFSVKNSFSDPGLKTLDAPTKFEVAKETLIQLNRTIPDLKLNGGVRLLGTSNKLIYGFSKWDRRNLEQSVEGLSLTGGTTPLGNALHNANLDLKNSAGKVAAIIISDGLPTNSPVLEKVAALKKQFGDRLCLYTILVGDNPNGKKLMADIAADGNCGYSINAANLVNSPKDMANFVTNVFLEKSLEAGLLTVHFDLNKSTVIPGFHEELKNAANFLKSHPEINLILQGYTCNMGPESYNIKLSKKRAENVKNYLVNNLGIAANRIKTQGLGSANPLNANRNIAEKRINRRVEGHIDNKQ